MTEWIGIVNFALMDVKGIISQDATSQIMNLALSMIEY